MPQRSDLERIARSLEVLSADALRQLHAKLDHIIAHLHHITQLEVRQMALIDDVLASVEELPTINDSLDALFTQLQALIAAGGTDPAKLQQALDLVSTQKARTKAAILANTPAAPPTP